MTKTTTEKELIIFPSYAWMSVCLSFCFIYQSKQSFQIFKNHSVKAIKETLYIWHYLVQLLYFQYKNWFWQNKFLLLVLRGVIFSCDEL